VLVQFHTQQRTIVHMIAPAAECCDDSRKKKDVIVAMTIHWQTTWSVILQPGQFAPIRSEFKCNCCATVSQLAPKTTV